MPDNPKTDKPKPDNRTVAQKRRAEYQERQREFLRGMGLIAAIKADLEAEHEDDKLPIVKWRNDTRLKLVNKILPDLKQTEVANADGEDFRLDVKGDLVETADALLRKVRGA